MKWDGLRDGKPASRYNCHVRNGRKIALFAVGAPAGTCGRCDIILSRTAAAVARRSSWTFHWERVDGVRLCYVLASRVCDLYHCAFARTYLARARINQPYLIYIHYLITFYDLNWIVVNSLQLSIYLLQRCIIVTYGPECIFWMLLMILQVFLELLLDYERWAE